LAGTYFKQQLDAHRCYFVSFLGEEWGITLASFFFCSAVVGIVTFLIVYSNKERWKLSPLLPANTVLIRPKERKKGTKRKKNAEAKTKQHFLFFGSSSIRRG
jgi:hypothetical protein